MTRALFRTTTVIGTVGLISFGAYANERLVRDFPLRSDRFNTSVAAEGSRASRLEALETIPLTVRFDDQSGELSQKEDMALCATLESLRGEVSVKRVIVAGWSDKALPREKQELMGTDRELARIRTAAVEKFLEKMGLRYIETYNMAEHPGWLANAFHTEEAKLKKSLQGTPSKEQQVNQIARTLSEQGGPSTVVILMILDDYAETAAAH